MTNEELESKIYDTFYDLNPEGDARSNGLWKDVIDAKNDPESNKALQGVLIGVENEYYY